MLWEKLRVFGLENTEHTDHWPKSGFAKLWQTKLAGLVQQKMDVKLMLFAYLSIHSEPFSNFFLGNYNSLISLYTTY